MPDPSATRRHHSLPMRHGNPNRREVWRVIQAEERKLSSSWSFKISLEGSSSRGGASRKTATGHESGQSVMGRRKGAFG